ncbi:MAG: glycosyltransferase family 4 protein [Patescibacteria group bacterium]
MKIVYILPEYRRNIGTHFYYNYQFIKSIREHHDVVLLIERGEAPIDFPGARLMWFRSLPLRILEMFVRFFMLRLRGYRVFWVHYSFVGGILAPLFGRSFYWNCGMPWLYRRQWVEERVFRFALRKSTLVTGTEGMKYSYIKQYALNPSRVAVLPNWIDHARFTAWSGRKKEARERLHIDEEKKVIFFLHHLSRRKGAHMIAPTAETFINDSSVEFIIGGSGPLEHTFVGKNIREVGEIPYEDVPMYFAASDLFFMPSEEEGFPHVVLEAMALGVPIVASDVGGVREILPREAQEFILEQSPDLFAAAIRKLLGDQELREQLAESGKIWVSQYSLEIVNHQFEEIICGRR